jgi:hypothetical protein
MTPPLWCGDSSAPVAIAGLLQATGQGFFSTTFEKVPNRAGPAEREIVLSRCLPDCIKGINRGPPDMATPLLSSLVDALVLQWSSRERVVEDNASRE